MTPKRLVNCETCGSLVYVVAADEGTMSYEPIPPGEGARLEIICTRCGGLLASIASARGGGIDLGRLRCSCGGAVRMARHYDY